MKRATRWAAVLAVVFGAAPALLRADDATATGDLKKMQGAWVPANDQTPEGRWVFEGETLKATVNDREYTCTLSLDPKATPHRAIDFSVKEGPDDSAGKSSKGIYKFDGDRLVLCVALLGNDARPTEFKTVDKETHVIELKPEK